GVDGVIAWDQAVLNACLRHGIEPHLSTQASVTNSAAILQYFNQFGIRRFVLARECTLEQVERIQLALRAAIPDNDIELETFCHGAMCVSVSGRCFMSEHTFGRSANRGDCLQPCRREFKIMDVEGESEYVLGQDYVMSPKDLCTLPFVEKLIEAGVSSLKIEGRNRSPEYVSTVTDAYRRVTDFYF
ncbi:MAG: U32 family peptidase, partial [Planctomycetes bacterium]|nr:U32 family peptidase [Planctomycetota bacterium]